MLLVPVQLVDKALGGAQRVFVFVQEMCLVWNLVNFQLDQSRQCNGCLVVGCIILVTTGDSKELFGGQNPEVKGLLAMDLKSLICFLGQVFFQGVLEVVRVCLPKCCKCGLVCFMFMIRISCFMFVMFHFQGGVLHASFLSSMMYLIYLSLFES